MRNTGDPFSGSSLKVEAFGGSLIVIGSRCFTTGVDVRPEVVASLVDFRKINSSVMYAFHNGAKTHLGFDLAIK